MVVIVRIHLMASIDFWWNSINSFDASAICMLNKINFNWVTTKESCFVVVFSANVFAVVVFYVVHVVVVFFAVVDTRYQKPTGCSIIKFTFWIDQFLNPLILVRDCSVSEIFVLISHFKRTIFECSSIFTFRVIKHSIEYL